MLRIKTFGLHTIYVDWLTIFQYTFIICIILNFRSIWMHTDSMSYVGGIINFLMAISIICGVFAKRKISYRKMFKCLTVMGCLVLYGGIWYLMDALKSDRIFTILLQILAVLAYCLLIERSIEDTMRKYTNIVLFIAVVSLFFWVFGSLLGFIHSTGFLYTTWTGNDSLKEVISYYGIYYETQMETFFGLTSYDIVRNTAIFTEAPMASMVFGIAFTNELLIQDKLNWKRCAVLAVAVISTLSTTGCTVLIIAVGLRYIFTKSKTKGAISLKLLLLPTTVVVALVALNFLLEQKLGTGSGSTRVDDFVAGYKAWLDAPLFGNGYGNTASYVRYMSSFRRNNIGFSNSLMQVLAYGGIYLFLPYCVSLISGFVQLIKGRMWRRMSFYITFIYAFIITVCPFQMLTFYLFISMARGVKKTEITQQQTERLSD